MKNLITCLVVCVLSGVVAAEIHHVPADFPTIQYAIDAALDGDEIIVAPGTYTSTADEVVHMLGKEIWLHSSAGEGVTILNGEGTRRGIYCNNGESSNTRIEGFTITNCYAYSGGGFYCDNSDPTITNCIFDGNQVVDVGGGMYNVDSNLTLTNCTFENNTADSAGGAMYNANSSPQIYDCTFTNNLTINSRGGAMYNNGSNPYLENCTFTNNWSAIDAGGMRNYKSSPYLNNCTFESNNAGSGGGVSNITNSFPTLENCDFMNNAANYGGGIYNYSDSGCTLTSCSLTNNTASYSGGGMYNQDVYNDDEITLIDTVVCGNSPDQINRAWADGGGNTVCDDCNGNGIHDHVEIADGVSEDCNDNGIPDDCENYQCGVLYPIQWTTGSGANGHWYVGIRIAHYIEEANHSWCGCQEFAEDNGGHLVTLTSSTEASWVFSNVSSSPYLWIYNDHAYGPYIGAFKDNGNWNWVTGEEWDYTNWAPFEPWGDGSIITYWGRYESSPTSTWNDLQDWCSLSNQLGAVLEWSADCNGDGIVDYGQILDSTLQDIDGNGIPDECEVDCNINGYPDDYDIKMGWSDDVNGDGIPDECQCLADINGDGYVGITDLLAVIDVWGCTDCSDVDVNLDGIVNRDDLINVFNDWGACP